MAKKKLTPKQIALKKLLIVFAYSGTSAAVPMLIALLENDARWVVLVPVINSLWYAITRYLKEAKLLEQK